MGAIRDHVARTQQSATPPFDARAELARIDREMAEMRKALQLEAKRAKREPWLLLAAAIAATITGLIGIVVACLPELLAAWQVWRTP